MTQQTNRIKLKWKLIPQAASVQLVYYLNLAPLKSVIKHFQVNSEIRCWNETSDYGCQKNGENAQTP